MGAVCAAQGLCEGSQEGVTRCVLKGCAALGGSRLPSGHSDGKKVENKWFCLLDLVFLKEERCGLAGCVCSESHLLLFFPLELPVHGSPSVPMRAVGSSVSGSMGTEL